MNLFVYLVFVVCLGVVTADIGWVEPNAWAISRNGDSQTTDQCNCNCNALTDGTKAPQPHNGNVAEEVYLKLVNYVFNKKHMTKSEIGETHWIDWHLAITANELQLLTDATKSKDFHTIDSIVSEVLYKSQSSNIVRIILNTWRDYFDHFFGWTWQSAESRTAVKFLATIAFIYCVSRRYGYSVVWVALCTIMIYSYYMAYLKCNHELTIEELGKIMRQNRENPCEIKPNDSLWSRIFASNQEDTCVKHMKESYAKQDYECAPLDVAMKMFSDISFKQLSYFMDHLGDKMQSLMKLGFPYNIIMTLFLLYVIVIIFKALIKNSFRYVLSPNVWMHKSHNAPIASNASVDALTNSINSQLRTSGVENVLRIEIVTTANPAVKKSTPDIMFTAIEECRDDHQLVTKENKEINGSKNINKSDNEAQGKQSEKDEEEKPKEDVAELKKAELPVL